MPLITSSQPGPVGNHWIDNKKYDIIKKNQLLKEYLHINSKFNFRVTSKITSMLNSKRLQPIEQTIKSNN